MLKIKDITDYLDSYAPGSYQESYDNSGLLAGNKNDELKGALISLDATEAVVEEAIEKKCNLVVSHHPIIFRGLKKLTGSNYVERTVIKAIQNNIALYAIHTNLDNIYTGVNKKICEKLQLANTKILAPKDDQLNKLTTFIPREDADKVMEAVYKAGAGQIGNYSHCSFRVAGTGTFLPNEKANPHVGETGKLQREEETRVEFIFPAHLKNRVLAALKKAHPYEEVAYYLHALLNENQEVGSGMVGELESPMSGGEFIQYLKQKMELKLVKHTQVLDKPVKKVAVCGGAGSFLLRKAISQQADVFVSSDFKYHEYFDAEDKIVIADIGHYESEVFTKELIYETLYKNFSNIALHFSTTNTNPVIYT